MRKPEPVAFRKTVKLILLKRMHSDTTLYQQIKKYKY